MRTLVSIILLLLSASTSSYAALAEGDLVEDFTVQKYGSEETISLYDYEGHIIVLDFFAYWCGPCQTSSPKIETEIAEFYATTGGTANGIPVTVLAVSVDNRNPSAVDTFIKNAGLKLVGLDETQKGWRQFSQGYIPHFAVVNGVANSNYKQWEVLHTDSGYRGSTFYKNKAEQVEVTGGYEAWASEQIADETKRGHLEDIDQDGLSNLFEYACGTDPDNCDGHKALELSLSEDDSYVLRFTESKAAIGLETLIQFSNNLEDWDSLSPDVGTMTELDNGELRSIEISIPGSIETGKFWRRLVRQNGSGN